MSKIFDKWNNIKKGLNDNKVYFQFRERDIFFLSIGKNIGYEQDGHGDDFKRPVLVYKKFNKFIFLGIPLTTKIKNDKFHFEFEYKKGTRSFAILSQIRLYDIRRANYHDGKISKEKFNQLQKKLLDLIVTPLQKQRVCTKAICDQIMPKKKLNVNNILVTGSNGQLGSEIKELSLNYNYNFFFTSKDTLDITNKEHIKEFINKNNIDTIINCAAYTAVDKAEKDEINADSINHLAVKNLAMIAKEKSIKLIHISTDYVFDGKNFRPYVEDDIPNPTGVYGKTKLDGENAIREINPKNSIIIRTSWVYSSFGANFVKTMLKLGKERDSLGVIFDQVGTPTYARDLALALLKIMNYELEVMNEESEENKKIIQNSKFKTQNSVSVYNYSNEGAVSWYDFAKEIMRMAKIECYINPIETKEYPTPASRPHFSLLNKTKIKKEFNLTIPYWKDSLDECLKKMGERK